jgi:uncharacterized protein involved in exopolysaccharide biosynthesis
LKNFSFDIIDILSILKKWKKFYLIYISIAIAATVVAVFNLPVSYLATTVLFPPEQDPSFNLASQLSLSKLSGSLLSPKDDFENNFTAIFQSQALKDDVIKKFDLIKVYKFDKKKKYYLIDLYKKYDKNVFFSITDEGMMVVSVVDRDAIRSSEMANYIALKIDDIYHHLMTENARNQRKFIEDRLSVIRNDLDSAEVRYNRFQKTHSVVDIQEQTKATIEANSLIETQYFVVQQKLNIAKRIYNFDNPEIKSLELEMKMLEKQRNDIFNKKSSNVLIPLVNAPDLGMEFLRLKRNLTIQESIFEFATQQYEKAKYDEAKQTPNILVLDQAKVPDKRFKPKRKNILLISFMLNTLLCCCIIFIIEYWRSIKTSNTVTYQKIVNLIKSK